MIILLPRPMSLKRRGYMTSTFYRTSNFRRSRFGYYLSACGTPVSGGTATTTISTTLFESYCAVAFLQNYFRIHPHPAIPSTSRRLLLEELVSTEIHKHEVNVENLGLVATTEITKTNKQRKVTKLELLDCCETAELVRGCNESAECFKKSSFLSSCSLYNTP